MKRITLIVLPFIWYFLGFNLYRNLDFFELYVYSLPGLSFNLAAVLARVFLGFCGSIPLILISPPFTEKINRSLLFIPTTLSLLLIANQLLLSTYTCKCFIHNAWNERFVFELFFALVSIGTFIIYNCMKLGRQLPFKRVIFSLLSLTLFVLVFILNAPDLFLYKKPQHILTPFSYNQLKNNGVDLFKQLNGKEKFQTVCLFNPNCQFCQRASTKMYLIAKKNGFIEHVTFVFSGDPSTIPSFMETYQIENIQTRYLNGEDLLHVANGTIPNILIMSNDTIHYNFSYRDMYESVFEEVYP
jgi:hypothetical protein